MKRILFILTFVTLTVGAGAQITILSTDMPAVGDTLRYSTTNTDLSALLTQSGANQTWNASRIVPDFQDIAKYKTPSSISLLYLSSFGTSTYGTASASGMNLGPLSGSDGYDFFKNTTGSFVQDGRGFSIQGIPLSQNWKDTVLRFPVAFGNVDSCKFLSNEVNVVVASTLHLGKRVNSVDGWGSLTTPYGTFDCLRVKSVLRTVDTLKSTLLPIPIALPQVHMIYSWYAKGKKIPVLEIDVPQGAGSGQTTVRYRDVTRPEAFLDEASFSANATTFTTNSTDTCILSDNSAHTSVSRNWTITPNTFTFTGGTNSSSQQAKIFFTASGRYTVKLRVNFNAGADDTTIVNYITVGAGNTLKAGFTQSVTSTNTNTSVHFTDTTKGSPTSWKWSFDPTTVSFVNSTSEMSQNPDVKFNVEGFYAVTLGVSNGQGSDEITKQNLILVMSTGLNETMKASLHVYPNPVAEQIYVQGNAASIDLYDMTGQLIKQGQNASLQVSDCAEGLYLLKATAQDGSVKSVRIQVKH